MRLGEFAWITLSFSSALVAACGGHGEQVRKWSQEEIDELEAKWDTDWAFSGISTFAHLKHVKCLTRPNELFDIAIIGAPFDTAVSYRPGSHHFNLQEPASVPGRFAPPRRARPRIGASTPGASINPVPETGPRSSTAATSPVTPMDNAQALAQMSTAFSELAARTPLSPLLAKPKLITLGGDHSLSLPALRALKEAYGRPLRVLHFDAHLDTWHPAKYPSYWATEQSKFNHGSMFWLAGQEGLLSNSSSDGASVHAGLRTRLSGDGFGDLDDDDKQGWVRFTADDIDDLGTGGIVRNIMDTLGTEDPVYLSVDIDVLDPAFAPGTGTPEPGGWTTRELIRILRGVEGLNVVGGGCRRGRARVPGEWRGDGPRGCAGRFEILSSMVKEGHAGDGEVGDEGG
ncbi:hypothetical protein CIB48_g1661 [Xylaria polymorpha]|nr:hypothetical protein CIB48_g1661 [Xylaria polymorpha]